MPPAGDHPGFFTPTEHPHLLSAFANVPRQIGEEGERECKFLLSSSFPFPVSRSPLPPTDGVLRLGLVQILLFAAEPRHLQPLLWPRPRHYSQRLASTPYYKVQLRLNPFDINKNGTRWEE